MAVPWQTDAASCYAGYPTDKFADAYLPSFWPARLPNHVLSEETYKTVIDTSLPAARRVAALHQRAKWSRRLDDLGEYRVQINKMTEIFAELGIVESIEAPDRPGDTLPLPNTFYIERLPESAPAPTTPVASEPPGMPAQSQVGARRSRSS
jgi:hypothetical protein